MNMTAWGETKSLEEWAKMSPLTAAEIHLRISSGIKAEHAISMEKDPDPEYPPSGNPRKRYSRFRGVTWHKKKQRWYARIRCDGKDFGLGYYRTQIEAAIAYNEAAREKHGGDAQYNRL